MTKVARRHRTENAAEQDTPLSPSRSTLPTVAFGQRAFHLMQKQCGRCGFATKKSEFCLACQKFFHNVNEPKSIFPAHF
jgi:hypothetical protein